MSEIALNSENTESESKNFIREFIEADLESGKHQSIVTRFPPEPNGYLHIGHSKSIAINFGLAKDYKGVCHMRFDDTNPTKEETEYVDSILADIQWLGFDTGETIYYASDCFDRFYESAEELIRRGKAFVCDLTADEMRTYRGTLTEPGRESPFRNRSVDENLDLFRRMRAGEFSEGTRTLRAKIDMKSPNINMRDPVIFRIMFAHHHRTGDKWCVYPMYDFSHPLNDMIEGITHSICTLEFEDHRPLYDWVLNALETPCHPQQIEFAKLFLTRTVVSKRNLLRLVKEGIVDGWDDPRLSTLAAFRRRGVPPEAIRALCEMVGVAKSNSIVDIAMLDFCIREELNRVATRRMVVLRPLKLTITNYPEDQVEMLDAENNPEDPDAGKRQIPFCRDLWIEQDDFLEDAPKKWFRFAPGKEVRLKHAYYVTCNEVVKDPDTGQVIELRCSYDPSSRGGWTDDGRKVRGTTHWVSARHGETVEVRNYDFLVTEDYDPSRDFMEQLNPESLEVLVNCQAEPGMKDVPSGERFQFLRMGYYAADTKDHKPGEKPVFNRIVGLKDSWAKLAKKIGAGG